MILLLLHDTWDSQQHSIINPSEKSSDAKCIAVLRSFILLLWPTHAPHCLATCSSFPFTLRLFRYLGYPWMRASEVVVSLPAPCAEYLVAKLASPTSRTHSGPRAHRWSTRCARNRDKRISRVEQLQSHHVDLNCNLGQKSKKSGSAMLKPSLFYRFSQIFNSVFFSWSMLIWGSSYRCNAFLQRHAACKLSQIEQPRRATQLEILQIQNNVQGFRRLASF